MYVHIWIIGTLQPNLAIWVTYHIPILELIILIKFALSMIMILLLRMVF